jgi:hypothetical protein
MGLGIGDRFQTLVETRPIIITALRGIRPKLHYPAGSQGYVDEEGKHGWIRVRMDADPGQLYEMRRGEVVALPPLEPALPPLEPALPPLEPVMPPLEPALPPLEPALPPLEPALPPLEPALPPLEPVMDKWRPEYELSSRRRTTPADPERYRAIGREAALRMRVSRKEKS